MFYKGKQASILKYSSLKLKSLTFFMRFHLIMQLTPVFLSGKSHGQRGLAGYSPWGHKSQTQLSEDSEESHQFNDGPPTEAPHHAYSVFTVIHGPLHGAEAMTTKCFTSSLHTFRPLEVEWNPTQCELKRCVLILDWAKKGMCGIFHSLLPPWGKWRPVFYRVWLQGNGASATWIPEWVMKQKPSAPPQSISYSRTISKK